MKKMLSNVETCPNQQPSHPSGEEMLLGHIKEAEKGR